MVKKNESNQYDHHNLFTDSDQSSGNAIHEFVVELMSESSTMAEPIKPPPQQPTPMKMNYKLGLCVQSVLTGFGE